jgi:Zn-dependent peptidase ImmA (M78 family)
VNWRDEAIRICSEHFPNGPEQLAQSMNIAVRYAPLLGADGWCVRGEANTVIRISSLATTARQRFTLAHELAHLALGTKPDIAREPFRSDNDEERNADRLASEFLIPTGELHRFLHGKLPVDAKTLERLAKAAKVSPVMAACRVVASAVELGLKNAAVVFYSDEAEQWRLSQGLKFDERAARNLLSQAVAAKPNLVRENNHDGNVVVGSIIDAQVYQVLLIQLLPPETANQPTREERLRILSADVFGDDHSFRQSVAAALGFVKKNCAGQTLDEAVSFFNNRYFVGKYSPAKEDKLRSAAGREYIELYLEKWFR